MDRSKAICYNLTNNLGIKSTNNVCKHVVFCKSNIKFLGINACSIS